MFKLGDKVKWTSQAGGHTKEKTGKVVRIIRVREEPARIAAREFPNHKRMFDGYFLPIGYRIAFLVEVIPSPRTKPRLYMPYPKNLKLIEG